MNQALFVNIFAYTLGKFAGRKTARETLAYLDRILWPLCKIHPNAGLYAAAASARCQILFTEDLQAGRTVHGVEIRNPFA